MPTYLQGLTIGLGYVKDTFWNHLRFRLTDRD